MDEGKLLYCLCGLFKVEKNLVVLFCGGNGVICIMSDFFLCVF